MSQALLERTAKDETQSPPLKMAPSAAEDNSFLNKKKSNASIDSVPLHRPVISKGPRTNSHKVPTDSLVASKQFDDFYMPNSKSEKSYEYDDSEIREMIDQSNKPDQITIKLLRDVKLALEKGVEPTSISSGSSGSYFIKNTDYVIAGIFKPRDEEPYAILNPKLAKYIQRKLFPCCFGRSCLLVGQGYLSEAGAYLVDEHFGFRIVPKTYVVKISHPIFSYFPHERSKLFNKNRNQRNPTDSLNETQEFHHSQVKLRPKIGSFQHFLHDFLPSKVLLDQLEKSNEVASELFNSFIDEFQKMVIFDYLIRNTDRSLENWLVKISESEVKIAAIDNGLAFPYKHPDEWRAYPYPWCFLKWANLPFTASIKSKFAPLLQNSDQVEMLVDKLRTLFSIDKSFNETTFTHQMSVLRGQVLNLGHILTSEKEKSPQDLVAMPVMLVIKGTIPMMPHKYSQDIYIGKINEKNPCFKCW